MKRILVCLSLLVLIISQSTFIGLASETPFEINADSQKVALLGGGDFSLNLQGATGNVSWSVHNQSICSVIGNDSSVTITPLSAGNAVITATCENRVAYAQIRIIDVANSADAQIVVSDFYKKGEEANFYFSVEGYTEFYNFKGDWSVTDENGNLVEIVQNGEKCLISGDKVNVGSYFVSLVSPGFSKITTEIKVGEINTDEIINKYLWVVALFVVILLVITILTKKSGSKLKRVNRQLALVIEKFNKTKEKANGGNTLIFRDRLNKANVSLKVVVSEIQVMNMDNFGYYQTIQDEMIKLCRVIDNLIMSPNETFNVVEFMDKCLEKLKEIEVKCKNLLEIEKAPQKQVFSQVEEINLKSQQTKRERQMEILFNGLEDGDEDDDD